MVSKIFQTSRGKLLKPTDATNRAGGRAYALPPKQALAQYAATGCFGHTYYASAEEQLEEVLALCQQVEPRFIAACALFSRQKSFLKDMPALLCAMLASRGENRLLKLVFPRVVDNGKMLRTFVQIVRSGATGRKSLGTAPKKLIRQWLHAQTPEGLFRQSVGQAPSIADILRMVHTKPSTQYEEATWGYLLGKEKVNREFLPPLVLGFEHFKRNHETTALMPRVPFQMLTALPLKPEQWARIAEFSSWQTVRMNLNTFARHGVFQLPGMTNSIAAKLRDAKAIQSAKAFPYQLMMAYKAADPAVPTEVLCALQDAMDVALANVPAIDGRVAVCVDVSGSMDAPVTGGQKKGPSTKVQCREVAALIASAIVHKNNSTVVFPFSDSVYAGRLNPRDSVITNAQALARLGGGGTNISAPMLEILANRFQFDLVVYASDNESWMESFRDGHLSGKATQLMSAWERYRAEVNPDAKLVCIDLAPNTHAQAYERADILNIGGFSDHVFELLSSFAKGEMNPDHLVGQIESALDALEGTN